MFRGERPTQQNHQPADPCPPWCIEPRELDDDLGDHVHTAARREVACVRLRRRHSPNDSHAPERRAEAVTYDLVRYRYSGDYEDWFYIGDEAYGLDLSLESVRRLTETLREYLDDMP